MNSVRTTVVMCLAFVALVLGMFYYSTTREPVMSVEDLGELGVFVLPRPRDLADFDLEVHDETAFTRASLEGQWNFLFFGFTNCPDICPTSMAVMGQAARTLEQAGEGTFRGILVSVDPERDLPEKLAAYATAFHPDFIGVRGDIPELAEFGRQLNVAFAKVPDGAGGYTMDHTGNIVVINPRGHYHGFIKMPHKADVIVQTYRSLRETVD